MSEYSEFEEKLNVYTHKAGAFLGLIGLVLLIHKGMSGYSLIDNIGFVVFGLSIVALYSASAMYHDATDPKKRRKLKILDHCAIYVLIAGSYTPFAISVFQGNLGWKILAGAWILATLGVIKKLFLIGRFPHLSTVLYVAMGWMVMFFVEPLRDNFPSNGFDLLLIGGISYTIGAVIYSVDKVKLNHAIFHVFVLIGSSCHYLAVYLYV